MVARVVDATSRSGDVLDSINMQIHADSTATAWLSAWDTGTSPHNAGSAEVYLQNGGTETAWVDSAYLNAATNSF